MFLEEILYWETWDIDDHYTLLIEFTVDSISTDEDGRLQYA
jgi:hypothetical protein